MNPNSAGPSGEPSGRFAIVLPRPLIVDPPSRAPAVNSNGIRKSFCPGSGFAPIFWSSDTM